MSLTLETLILALVMALLCALPMISGRVRKHSQVIFLIGTGSMFGITVFDLVPDVFELGGSKSLYVIGAVWALYSGLHLSHLGHRPHEQDHENDSGVGGEPLSKPLSPFFLVSISSHCFASGMLLAVSQSISKKLAGTVFVALLAHKAYESLAVSSVLVHGGKLKVSRAAVIFLYAISLPVGVFVAVAFAGVMNQNIAILISSIAAGTLMGCLIFDFLIPSFRFLQEKRARAVWVAFGLLVTELVMRGL